MESSNKKFLAPAVVSAGEFSGNVYRLTEEFRQGEKKGTNHSAHPATVPRFQSARLKKKKKGRFQIVAPPPPLLQERKKKSGGGECLELPISACESPPTHCYSWAQEIA